MHTHRRLARVSGQDRVLLKGVRQHRQRRCVLPEALQDADEFSDVIQHSGKEGRCGGDQISHALYQYGTRTTPSRVHEGDAQLDLLTDHEKSGLEVDLEGEGTSEEVIRPEGG